MSESLPVTPPSSEAEPKLEKLPASLDKETTLFSYGYLLDIPNLHGLLQDIQKLGEKPRAIDILEAQDLAEAEQLTGSHPESIIILRGARLENVHVSVVSEKELHDQYEKRGRDIKPLVEKGIQQATPREHAYLYSRRPQKDERGRFLNGGLIIGLKKEELEHLDDYEYDPVYRRQPVNELTIADKRYRSESITFYEGNGPLERTPEDKVRASKYVRSDRSNLGERGPNAKWPPGVRKRK